MNVDKKKNIKGKTARAKQAAQAWAVRVAMRNLRLDRSQIEEDARGEG